MTVYTARSLHVPLVVLYNDATSQVTNQSKLRNITARDVGAICFLHVASVFLSLDTIHYNYFNVRSTGDRNQLN